MGSENNMVAGPELLDELATFLPSIRVFLTSRERSHEAGVQWFDEIVTKVGSLRATPASDIVAKANEHVKGGDYRMAYLTMCEAYGKLGSEAHRAGVGNRPLNHETLASPQPDAQQGEGLTVRRWNDERGVYEYVATPSSPALDAATIERCAVLCREYAEKAGFQRQLSTIDGNDSDGEWYWSGRQQGALDLAAALDVLPNAEKRHG